MFFSTKRAVGSAIVALAVEFYVFNFVPKNINILAARSVERQIFAYILNFVIFFAVIYLAVTLIIYLIKWLSAKKVGNGSLFNLTIDIF